MNQSTNQQVSRLNSINFPLQDILATNADQLTNMSQLDPVALASRLVCGGGQSIFGLNNNQISGDGDNNGDSPTGGTANTNPNGSPRDSGNNETLEEQERRYEEALKSNLAAGACKLFLKILKGDQLCKVPYILC